jgi:HK97 family phage major capsid protein
VEDTKQQTAAPAAPEPAAPASTVARDFLNQERVIREQAARDMTKRNADIIAFGDKFETYGGRELAQKAILDSSITFDGFREQLLELVSQRVSRPTFKPDLPRQGNSGTSYGMGARDMIASANLQTFRGIGKVLGKEDHEIAYRAGMWARGVIFGDASALGWCRDHGVELIQGEQLGNAARTMTEGVFTSAGWLVPIEMESAIISNREQYGVARRICNVIPMGSASMTLPRVTSDITAYFVGEGNTGTASDSAGDQVQLNLKDLMAYTQIGKSTAMDAVIPLAEMVAREQARAFAIKEDACLIIGDGTSTYGGMLGIVTLLETAAYAGGRGLAATNHDTFGEMDATDVAALIGKLPVYARAGARFVVSGVGEAMIFGRLKLTAGGQDTGTLQGGILEQSYAGFPVSVAHNMPAGATTDYSNKILALLGNFQLGVAFGSGSGMMLTVDPYTNAHQNLTRIITTERIDIVSHGVNKSTTIAGPICGLFGE